ncbi:MAG: hypothetical protein DSY90_03350 [Deltaproteobacteria bacterium]|nr:MAG: hypothetical protein DSY90_03350 [Deltaproteobacteria bacterium]
MVNPHPIHVIDQCCQRALIRIIMNKGVDEEGLVVDTADMLKLHTVFCPRQKGRPLAEPPFVF